MVIGLLYDYKRDYNIKDDLYCDFSYETEVQNVRNAVNQLGRIKRQLSFDIWRQIKKRPLVSGMFAVFLPISLSLLTTKYMQSLPEYIDWILIVFPIGLILYLLSCQPKNKC